MRLNNLLIMSSSHLQFDLSRPAFNYGSLLGVDVQIKQRES